MKDKTLLAKSIILLYKESLMKNQSFSYRDKIYKIIEDVSNRLPPDINVIQSSDKTLITNLLSRIREMLNYGPEAEYIHEEFLNDLEVDCDGDKILFKMIKESIQPQSEEDLKKSVVSIRRAIDNHYKEKELETILNKADYAFRFKRESITDISAFISNLIADLEKNSSLNGKDPAITSELDISNKDNIEDVLKIAVDKNSDEGLIKTGWQALNTAIQGGFRRGEFWLISALASNWKTGFSMSIFKQIALYNKPYMLDPNKKPLLVRISAEDDIEANMQLLYQALKYTDTKEQVDISRESIPEMSAYIRDRLSENGYHVKFLRIDPSDWSYSKLLNKLTEYEAEGYEIHCCMVDYLSMIPTTGCFALGGTGSDLRDMFRRVRNYMSVRKILFITPHQLSSEASKLLRGTVAEEDFTKLVAKKGYYDTCARLIQEVDGGLVIHSFNKGDDRYFSLTVEKHRSPTAIPESLKSFYMKYPTITDKKIGGMPIPDDINGECQAFRVFKDSVNNGRAEEDLFKF